MIINICYINKNNKNNNINNQNIFTNSCWKNLDIVFHNKFTRSR